MCFLEAALDITVFSNFFRQASPEGKFSLRFLWQSLNWHFDVVTACAHTSNNNMILLSSFPSSQPVCVYSAVSLRWQKLKW